MLYFFEDYSLDTARRELRRGGGLVSVEPKVFDLLVHLIGNRERVVSKDNLIEAVWNGRIVSESTLTSCINAARSAIGDSGEAQRVIKTLPRKGVRFVATVRQENNRSELPGADMQPPGPALILPDKPSVAVLPFTNMSSDPEQEYFGDGISEDIITALTRSRWFFVIARNSSFAFKGKSIDARQVARELGVQYVLEGSVRKSGQRVRIAAQLIDANLARQVWAERFDFELSDVFVVQDEITERVVGAIEPELLKSEGLRASTRGAQNLNAWDLVRQGTWQFHHVTKPTHMRARELFCSAVGLDPRLAEAHMWLGRVIASAIAYGWSDDPAADLQEAVRSSLKGIELDEKDPYGHYALFVSYLVSGALEEAIQAAERAVELSPTFALAHLSVGMARLYAGDAAGAIEPLARGLRLNPFDPQNFLWFRTLALAYCFSGKPTDGLLFAMKAVQVRPSWRPALEAVVVCQVDSDRLVDATRSAERWRTLGKPEKDVLEPLKMRNPQWADRMMSALFTAGCVD